MYSSYQFTAISTSYLNVVGSFWINFSVPVISWIESIGGGRVRGRWGKAGRVGSQRRTKTTIWTQAAAVLCLQYGT